MRQRRRWASTSFQNFWLFFLVLVSTWVLLISQYVGSAWEELKHIRQAVGFLVQDIFNISWILVLILMLFSGLIVCYSILGDTSKTQEDLKWNNKGALPCECPFYSLFFFLSKINVRFTSGGFIVALQVLSIQQLYRISTMYWDDKYGTHSVSSDVI